MRLHPPPVFCFLFSCVHWFENIAFPADNGGNSRCCRLELILSGAEKAWQSGRISPMLYGVVAFVKAKLPNGSP